MKRTLRSIMMRLERSQMSSEPERFRHAYEILIKLSGLRTESVKKQLNGELATRSEDQAEEDKVDSSDVVIKDIGSASDVK